MLSQLNFQNRSFRHIIIGIIAMIMLATVTGTVLAHARSIPQSKCGYPQYTEYGNVFNLWGPTYRWARFDYYKTNGRWYHFYRGYIWIEGIRYYQGITVCWR